MKLKERDSETKPTNIKTTNNFPRVRFGHTCSSVDSVSSRFLGAFHSSAKIGQHFEEKFLNDTLMCPLLSAFIGCLFVGIRGYDH